MLIVSDKLQIFSFCSTLFAAKRNGLLIFIGLFDKERFVFSSQCDVLMLKNPIIPFSVSNLCHKLTVQSLCCSFECVILSNLFTGSMLFDQLTHPALYRRLFLLFLIHFPFFFISLFIFLYILYF